MMRTTQSSYVICGSIHLQSCVVPINTVDSSAYKDHVWIVFQVFFPMDQAIQYLEFPNKSYGNFIEDCTCYHDDTRELEIHGESIHFILIYHT